MKKSIGVILLLLIISLSSCNKESSEHTHDYRLKNDEKLHYQECSCGEKKDSANHNLGWKVDTEPTYSAPGYQHKECTVCGYITEENTVIERLLHEEMIYSDEVSDGVNGEISSFVKFEDYFELEAFYCANKDKIQANIYCINPTLNLDEDIEIIDKPYSLTYYLGYKELEDLYNNAQIRVLFGIYSNNLENGSPAYSAIGYHASIEFSVSFYGSLENLDNLDNLELEFYKYKHNKFKWNYTIKVINMEKEIGEIFYCTDLDINREWIVNYLTKNMVLLRQGDDL